MSNKITDNLVIPLQNIIYKKTGELTLQEALSAAFHATQAIGSSHTGLSEKARFTAQLWNDLYGEHVQELRNQTEQGWPKPNFRNNRIQLRRDLDTLSQSFLRSDNYLTLILRLLYLEVFKNASNFSFSCINVLDLHPYDENNTEIMGELTLARIFYLVRMALVKYLRVYNSQGTFENELGSAILTALTSH